MDEATSGSIGTGRGRAIHMPRFGLAGRVLVNADTGGVDHDDVAVVSL